MDLCAFAQVARTMWKVAGNEIFKQEVRRILAVLDEEIDERERQEVEYSVPPKTTRDVRIR